MPIRAHDEDRDPPINPFQWVWAQVGWWVRGLRQGHPLHRWYARSWNKRPAVITTNPVKPPHRAPNCKPGDPVDAKGLVHAWQLVTDNGPGDLYECPRCGQKDVD